LKDKKTIVLLLVVLGIAATWLGSSPLRSRRSPEWNSSGIRAKYVSAQLREVDPQHASLLLSYDLTNNTDQDYRLADGPSMVVMSRIKSDHSLSSQEDVRLGYATFLPARQRARVALEIRRPFVWPEDNDALLENKLKDFVNQRLDDTEDFVLFDQTDRYQIEFPSGWQEFKLASTGANSLGH
jgi:hypothetical protein